MPGVGSFHSGMKTLDERGWSVALKNFASCGKPILGICLGMQLLFEKGYEGGEIAGLGLTKGTVERLQVRKSLKFHIG